MAYGKQLRMLRSHCAGGSVGLSSVRETVAGVLKKAGGVSPPAFQNAGHSLSQMGQTCKPSGMIAPQHTQNSMSHRPGRRQVHDSPRRNFRGSTQIAASVNLYRTVGAYNAYCIGIHFTRRPDLHRAKHCNGWTILFC